ncbi:hypothetical protein CMV00_07570 [Elizabethkingia anophelis]|nr:hypothetical protein [Elizabethkingia anophelis]
MSYKSSGGSIGCAGTVFVIALIVAFVFGNKKLGSTLIDVARWVIIAPVLIGIIYLIWDSFIKKNK